VEENNIDIDNSDLNFVKDIVTACKPVDGAALARMDRRPKFLYDIVANGRNGCGAVPCGSVLWSVRLTQTLLCTGAC
jgi:hypothetical protein